MLLASLGAISKTRLTSAVEIVFVVGNVPAVVELEFSGTGLIPVHLRIAVVIVAPKSNILIVSCPLELEKGQCLGHTRLALVEQAEIIGLRADLCPVGPIGEGLDEHLVTVLQLDG